MNYLSEDSIYILTDEAGNPLLQEFDSVDVSDTLSFTSNISVSAVFKSSLIDSFSLTDTVVGKKAITDQIEDIFSFQDFVFGRVPLSGAVSDVVGFSEDIVGYTIIKSSIQDSFIITSKFTSVGVIYSEILDSFEITDRISSPSLIPEEIRSFKGKRDGVSINLSWENGARTSKVKVYRSTGVRGQMSEIAEVSNADIYSDTNINPNETYSYQLIPVGIYGNIGKSTYVIYISGNNTIF